MMFGALQNFLNINLISSNSANLNDRIAKNAHIISGRFPLYFFHEFVLYERLKLNYNVQFSKIAITFEVTGKRTKVNQGTYGFFFSNEHTEHGKWFTMYHSGIRRYVYVYHVCLLVS